MLMHCTKGKTLFKCQAVPCRKAENPCCRIVPVDEDIMQAGSLLLFDLSNYSPKACLDGRASDFVKSHVAEKTIEAHFLFVNSLPMPAYPDEEQVIDAINSLEKPGMFASMLAAILEKSPYPHIRNAVREKSGDRDIEPPPEFKEKLLFAEEILVSKIIAEISRRSNSFFPAERSFYRSMLGPGHDEDHAVKIFRNVFEGKPGSFRKMLRFCASVCPDDIIILRNHCNFIDGRKPGWGRAYPPEQSVLDALERISSGAHIVKEELEQIAVMSPMEAARKKAGQLI